MIWAAALATLVLVYWTSELNEFWALVVAVPLVLALI